MMSGQTRYKEVHVSKDDSAWQQSPHPIEQHRPQEDSLGLAALSGLINLGSLILKIFFVLMLAMEKSLCLDTFFCAYVLGMSGFIHLQ
ncbi:hypothetical protein FGO68_gene15583 [Halteria grandinella]|uniref:Uncharacterized protein n=1 Tax=Halteria grandinella TaxID=5974 RepID=A0A8J8NXM9_HALGN|nr:hypothetical protein FGO68_gene15583 [Halteria grandinella]